MKKLPLMLLIVSGAALAQTAYVTPPGTRKAGDTIERSTYIYVLHESAPCALPIVNANHMRKAELYGTRGKPEIGCWIGTLSPVKGSFTTIGPEGNVFSSNLAAFAKVKLKPDGDAVIVDGWPSP